MCFQSRNRRLERLHTENSILRVGDEMHLTGPLLDFQRISKGQKTASNVERRQERESPERLSQRTGRASSKGVKNQQKQNNLLDEIESTTRTLASLALIGATQHSQRSTHARSSRQRAHGSFYHLHLSVELILERKFEDSALKNKLLGVPQSRYRPLCLCLLRKYHKAHTP